MEETIIYIVWFWQDHKNQIPLFTGLSYLIEAIQQVELFLGDIFFQIVVYIDLSDCWIGIGKDKSWVLPFVNDIRGLGVLIC